MSRHFWKTTSMLVQWNIYLSSLVKSMRTVSNMHTLNLPCKMKCLRFGQVCGGLNESVLTGFEYLVSPWRCFGRIRRCGFVKGSKSVGGGLWVHSPAPLAASLSASCTCWRFEHSVFGSYCLLPCLPDHGGLLSFCNCKPKKLFLLEIALIIVF